MRPSPKSLIPTRSPRPRRLPALEPYVASWYYDQGDTACGFHATYGVANKTLPCGTKVTIAYDGHTVVAEVDDRGPYVYGRDFDLGESTAHALGIVRRGRGSKRPSEPPATSRRRPGALGAGPWAVSGALGVG